MSAEEIWEKVKALPEDRRKKHFGKIMLAFAELMVEAIEYDKILYQGGVMKAVCEDIRNDEGIDLRK